MAVALIITTALLAIGSVTLILTVQVKASKLAKETRQRVWADGTPATATVVSATTNGSLNNHPRVLLHLEVNEPGKPRRRAQVTQVISQLMVGKIVPGDEIAIKVDPADPETVVVDPDLTPYGY